MTPGATSKTLDIFMGAGTKTTVAPGKLTTFTSPTLSATANISLATGDFDGDGNRDLVILQSTSPTATLTVISNVAGTAPITTQIAV